MIVPARIKNGTDMRMELSSALNNCCGKTRSEVEVWSTSPTVVVTIMSTAMGMPIANSPKKQITRVAIIVPDSAS
jgi:hypothetical protein